MQHTFCSYYVSRITGFGWKYVCNLMTNLAIELLLFYCSCVIIYSKFEEKTFAITRIQVKSIISLYCDKLFWIIALDTLIYLFLSDYENKEEIWSVVIKTYSRLTQEQLPLSLTSYLTFQILIGRIKVRTIIWELNKPWI